MKPKGKIFIILFHLLSPIFLLAQEGAYRISDGHLLSQEEWKLFSPADFPIFGTDEILEITLESNFKKLVRQKNKDTYQAGWIDIYLNDSLLVKHKVRIKARGELRKRFCAFPPLKLNVKKKDMLLEGMHQLDKVKMVTTCFKQKTFEEYLLKEYLIYKLFNLFTDKSFRVRLVKVKYIDTGRKNKVNEEFAFLIENEDDMAERNRAVIIKNRIHQDNTNPGHMTLLAVFQFMIGNTDWLVWTQHNAKVIQAEGGGSEFRYAIPYDFDYCGLVDAHYAIPTEGILDIKSVRERAFLGSCRTEEEFQAVFEIYRDKKSAVYNLINDFSYLPEKERKEITGYLDQFYEIIDSPKLVKRYFLDGCDRLKK